jgi:medium-chain acyl-[acyl-carrier-protein] hydrolase
MRKSQSKWFENLVEGKDEALRLFCFPYAGGNSHFYRAWQRHFSTEVGLSLAHLPGRGTRISEPASREHKLLINALADAIKPHLPPVFAFWWHSMGAMISFELARELRRRGQPGPLALFVSGRSAPQLPDRDPRTFDLPKQEFIAELRRLKGTPAEVLESAELTDLLLPTIRADFELIQRYEYESEPPLSCAIRAYGGLQDTEVPVAKLKAWQQQTTGTFKMRMFPGDHFYVHTSTDLVDALRRDLLDLMLEQPDRSPMEHLNF